MDPGAVETGARSVAAALGLGYACRHADRPDSVKMHTPQSHPERDKAMSMPLEQIDPSKGYLFEHDYIGWTFERLRTASATVPIGR